METSPHEKIVIAGATGFVGAEVARRLSQKFHVVGLSRSPRKAGDKGVTEWRSCDLNSLLDAEKAIEGKVAYYLVHSMLPSARLTQGSFADLDLIAADNFARAAKRNGVEQIIYLGGLIPAKGKLSRHLESRLEVEKNLAAYGTPVTALRAGLVLGGNGSSFQILLRLVQRLPAMLCPKWTDTPTQPIALEDVVALLCYCAGREDTFGQTFDIGSPEVTTYRGILAATSQVLGKKRYLVKFPAFTPALSKLWVKLITGAPGALVFPLIESLVHSMVAKDRRLQLQAGVPGLALVPAIEKAVQQSEAAGDAQPKAFSKQKPARESDVRSVQRLSLPKGRNADWAAREYLSWLSRLSIFSVKVSGAVCSFFFLPFLPALLILEYSAERSTADRALFYIRGGWLAKIQGRGRLEFRETFDKKSLLVAIHEYRPRLPWLVYAFTQARVHILVMQFFGKHLKKLAKIS